jgi:hypothetical protein
VNSLPAITQIIFLALAVLGLYMIWRAVQDVSVLQAQPGNRVAVIDHIGFILISLFDGFAIVTATDLQAPVWLVAVVAVSTVALGIYAINARKKTLVLATWSICSEKALARARDCLINRCRSRCNQGTIRECGQVLIWL